ncbi:MAG: 4-(cytidine 5'-diphospho)-2-C-methyl-D-erythritol kinase [Elusimicrobiaceae bacterium]|nr:4-(cytidine 5'-diphospho)-2-C-methyl-D-erythritol kinase [Elusimicrobiaceae bacterium]
MDTVHEFAPAKINLFLEVTGRRPDGYHELDTLFAKLNYGDRLEISAGPDLCGVELELTNKSGCELPGGGDNLAVKAATAYLTEFGIADGVRLRLEKHIPTGAGLGGGSSDAGAVLRGLDRLYGGEGLPNLPRLTQLGARLGADVPVFIRPEPFWRGRGIGDLLEPVPVKTVMPHVVLVYPGEGVSTAAAYKRLRPGSPDEILTNCRSLNKMVDSLGEGETLPGWKSLLYNRLEKAVLPVWTSVAEVKSELESLGADAVLMSGSGATVFALSDRGELAGEIALRARKPGRRVIKTAFLRRGSNGDYGDQNTSDERG